MAVGLHETVLRLFPDSPLCQSARRLIVEPAYSSVKSSPQHQVPRYNEHVTGDGPRFREPACKLGLEGVISKRADRP